ncbi:glycine oxidase ThiO [Pseudonocardiaceae bacterium YIM PH 21723]|nr:glycine oxidase ThiO [Pseudonocardiaceae bacterium YIM PH 21723]
MLRIAVVGGGVIGMSIAAKLANEHRVTVLDPEPGCGSSHVAGGMLAPVTEAWPGEEELLELGTASLAAWPEFAAGLTDPGLRTEGTLAVGVDSADRGDLRRLGEYLVSLGREAEELSGREVRRLEPSLGPAVRLGLSVPGDLAVDNRMLLRALRRACAEHEVEFADHRVTEVVDGQVVHETGTFDCDIAIIAAGAHSGALHPRLAKLVRPVKGEILRLRARKGAVRPPLRTVRAQVEGRHSYLVPRDDGGLVVGATQYETGFDPEVTVGGVRDLLRDAERVLPGLAEYALLETQAGFRPGSPDNLPIIGALSPQVLVATGHGRNGILLAPITVGGIADLVAGRPVDGPLSAAGPSRFAEGER